MKFNLLALCLVGAVAMCLSSPAHAAAIQSGMSAFKVLAVPQELPEPASIGVLAIGSMALLLRRRRR